MSASQVCEDVGLESLIGRVADEFLRRLEQGERPDVEEYAARHPEAAPVLRKVLKALGLLEQSFAGATPPGDAEGVGGPQGRLGDFRLLREVGRGGMGVVYEAEQVSLGRRVALKVLPFAGALDTRQLQRFKNEAQAAACLHHQHIVPVYFVGCEQGVHYYAMQFIDGQTVAAVIGAMRRPTPSEPRPSGSGGDAAPLPDGRGSETAAAALTTERSARDPAFFRRVAEWGIQAAEALEHAHQLGVVHRDIKPANLLLDGRGHLWVTDFGLAQFQRDTRLTLTGDLLGTLRYMSPEQAEGRHAQVDHRTDVYSLGVTLYELLTLAPPFDGNGREELLRQITQDEPRPPRRVNTAVPRELDTIVLKALAKEPAERYPTAQDLADDLRRFLDHRPIQARRPTVAERARKWVRRHRRLVTAALAVLALAVVGSTVGTVLIWREKQRAEARFRLARRAVDEMYTQAADELLADIPGMQQVQRGFLEKALRAYEEFAQEKGADPGIRHETAVAHYRVGVIHGKLGDAGKSEAALLRARELLDQLVTEFPEEIAYRHNLAEAQAQLGSLLMEARRYREAEEYYQQALNTLTRQGQAPVTYRSGRGAMARILNNFGGLLRRTGRLQEAEHHYRSALEMSQKLCADFPDDPDYQSMTGARLNNLAILARQRGELDEARRLLEQATDHQKSALKRKPRAQSYRQFLRNHYWVLGQALGELGRREEAEAAYREGLAVQEGLAADYPDLPSGRELLGNNHQRLADVLLGSGRYGEAEHHLRRVLEIREKLVEDFPARPVYKQELAVSLSNLGLVLQALGRFSEAFEHWQRSIALNAGVPDIKHRFARFLALCPDPRHRDTKLALDLARQAVKQNPKIAGYWNTLGLAQLRARDWDASVTACQKAIELSAGGNALDYFVLAMAYWQKGDKEPARMTYDQAIRWLEKQKPQDNELDTLRAEAAALLNAEKEPMDQASLRPGS